MVATRTASDKACDVTPKDAARVRSGVITISGLSIAAEEVTLPMPCTWARMSSSSALAAWISRSESSPARVICSSVPLPPDPTSILAPGMSATAARRVDSISVWVTSRSSILVRFTTMVAEVTEDVDPPPPPPPVEAVPVTWKMPVTCSTPTSEAAAWRATASVSSMVVPGAVVMLTWVWLLSEAGKNPVDRLPRSTSVRAKKASTPRTGIQRRRSAPRTTFR